MMKKIVARDVLNKPEELARKYFGTLIGKDGYDYQFTDTSLRQIIVIGQFEFGVPALKELYKDEELAVFFDRLLIHKSHFFQVNMVKNNIQYYIYENGAVKEADISNIYKDKILAILRNYKEWAGSLDEYGDHIIDLKTPVPGVHFYTNMLLGNRIGFSLPLQSTPKSVVDRFGGGSFRAHAANQVLATRWDMLPEENGFPANRQFYLVEQGKQIFYSADVNNANVVSAICRHSKNYTEINYITACGLQITRIIFLLPQYDGLPMATEVQRIKIKNIGTKERNVKLILTGMIASAVPSALMEDVVYSTVIMESGLLQNDEGDLLAYIPHYYPDYCNSNIRYSTAMFYEKEEKSYPTEIGTHYGEFIGSGNLYKPQGLNKLSNHLSTKGPGFIALAKQLIIGGMEEVVADHYTGLITTLEEGSVPEELVEREIKALHNKFVDIKAVDEALRVQLEWYDSYRSYLNINSENKKFNTYVNHNLPFQVLYQTFVSRSFDLTQKGYREIGFREIQDIFVSMYYLMAMGEVDYVKNLLREWIEKVFECGYCYHNFFWQGKEAGKWSDDGLWLVQAVYRFIQYTADLSFLDEEYELPETGGKTRTVYDTLKAIIKYSSEISIGNHGLPLIDYADWNDCLKVDMDFLTGAEKENKKGPFDGYSESVMNGFLLKLAMNHMEELSQSKGDLVYNQEIKIQKDKLSKNLQEHAWKKDFFARVLFNRYDENITYLGAKDDGFSSDENIPGTYFLNSFSWSILSDEATEEQIKIMLEQIEKYLINSFGIALMSPTDLSRVASATATGEYFPGDRENGGIFKHATMMATAAMIKAAKEVESQDVAKKLRDLAYWMMELVLPYKAIENPFKTCGNPRWCTQYINSQTGENIGPTLSGTSTWLALTLFEMLGISYKGDKLILNPLLDEAEKEMSFSVKYLDSNYKIRIKKPIGLFRVKESTYKVNVDGKDIEDNVIVLCNDGKNHKVEMEFVN